MPALVDRLESPATAATVGSSGTPRLRRSARITAHLLGWTLLVKIGLLSGFALTAAVQHLLAV